jgi:hypothetical protein
MTDPIKKGAHIVGVVGYAGRRDTKPKFRCADELLRLGGCPPNCVGIGDPPNSVQETPQSLNERFRLPFGKYPIALIDVWGQLDSSSAPIPDGVNVPQGDRLAVL